MPRVADVKRKLEIERSSLARNEADILRHQEEFNEIQKVRVGQCDRARKAIQELENWLIDARKKFEKGGEWPDGELTHKWETGLKDYEQFKDVDRARKIQFAYITTGSGAILASTVALLSAKVVDGFYENPAECPGWNISSKSSYIPVEATAAQEYATPNKDATVEAEIATHDEAFLNDNMSEIIEHPGELSQTIVAQNARASRIAILQGKAARRSDPGSSMVRSERDEFLNELPPWTNAQDTNEDASTMSGVPGKEARRSAAGSSMVLSERDEFSNQLPPSTNAQGAVKKRTELWWMPENAAGSSATETSRMRSKGPFPEPIEPMTELPRPTIQDVAIQTLYPQLFKLEPSCNNEWIKKIFEMPETRQLDLAKDHTLKLDDLTYGYEPQRLEAALGQIRGVVARKPCGHCKSKILKGPFATCVVVPGNDGRFFGACCNCVYQQYPLGKEKCTFFDNTVGPRKAEDKAKHPLRAASVALRSYLPKLRSIKSLPAEGLKEANPQSAAASQRQAERMWQVYPRGF